MRRFVLGVVSALIVVVGFGGCAKVGEQYFATPLSDANVTKFVLREKLQQASVITKDCNNSTTNCKAERNSAMAVMIMASDELCQAHIGNILGNEAGSNLTFGTLTTLFAGAATIASVSTVKTAWAALATVSNAERSLWNETIYKSMLSTAISKKIREHRLQKRIQLLKRMHNDSIENFTLNEALMDVTEYHDLCSYGYGLEKALDEGKQDSQELKKNTLKLQLQQLRAEKRLRELELGSDQNKSLYQQDTDWSGMDTRMKAIHDEIKLLETKQYDNNLSIDSNNTKEVK